MGHRIRVVSPLLAALVIGTLALAACDEDSSESPTATPTMGASATATFTPTATAALPTATTTATDEFPTPTPVATQAPGTRTGDSDVDRILDLLSNLDAAGLAEQTAILEFRCDATVRDPQVLPCPEGAPDGTPIFGVFVAHVEGGLRPPSEYEQIARSFIDLDPRFVAAYRREHAITDLALLFVIDTDEEQELAELALLHGEVTGYTRLASPPSAELLADPLHVDWILAPADLLQTYGWSTRTGVEVVDALLAAAEAGEPPPVEYTLLPCGQFAGSDPEPNCPEGEDELVEAFLATGCDGDWIRRVEHRPLGIDRTTLRLFAIGHSRPGQRPLDEGGFPSSDYVIVTSWVGSTGEVFGSAWFVGGSGLVHSAAGCLDPVADYAETVVDNSQPWLLPPR